MDYQYGFGNHFSSEALAGALPLKQNSPQRAPFGLYAEQLSGSAFTVPRANKLANWLYRIRPSVLQEPFIPLAQPRLKGNPFNTQPLSPNPLRWDPLPYPEQPTGFVQGLLTIAGNGNISDLQGGAIHLYTLTCSASDLYFYNCDGDFLFVPQEGGLILKTEFGTLEIKPGEIAVIPRGIKFQVQLLSDRARGYLLENFGAPFVLPELGLIGANGLANPRHFQYPVASYEELTGHFRLVCKTQGQLWESKIKHSPLDVVAWQGNYLPYKYDLSLFNALGSVSFDHPDPSIFTVLTSPSYIPGVANIDFVIFPDRWLVAEHTFRPPYYHRNIMSEYMGLIHGVYDAKEAGFAPGGSSIHNRMTAHGPDGPAYAKASQGELKPQHIKHTLAFMFESRYAWQPTELALNSPSLQKDYHHCWQELKAEFDPKKI